MWLSKQIKKQSKFKDALHDLERLIHNNDDATKIPTDETFWKRFLASELPNFRPNGWRFLVLVIAFAIVGFISQFFNPLQYSLESWAMVAVQVTIPIFVIAVSITTLAHSLSESGRFAAEYLHEACRMPLFCCVALVAAIMAILARVFSSIAAIPLLMSVPFITASLGAAIGCVMGLAFVIREVIRCTRPTESVRVASNYAANGLSLAFLKDAYLGLWMKSYGYMLEEWCSENCRAIHPPSQYFSSTLQLLTMKKTEMLNDIQVILPFKFDIFSGYMDYNLRQLKKLDRQLKEQAELFLAPHSLRGQKALLGTFRPCRGRSKKLVDVIKRNQCFRFQLDEFQQASEDFWENNFFKLHDALKRAITNLDPEQMQLFLKAVAHPIHVLRKAWKHRVVRDEYAKNPQRPYQLIFFYLDVVKQILEEETPQNTVKEKLSLKFLGMIRRSIWNEIKEIFESADYHTLELFCSLVPQMYKTLKTSSLGASEEGNRIRGHFGDFYAFSEGLFEHLPLETSSEERTKIRLVLHDGVTRWLLIGIDENDTELVQSLCAAGRRIVFHDENADWHEEPSLRLQHCLLAGNLISLAIDNKNVSAENIKHLFFEEFDAQPKPSLSDLVEFYSVNVGTVFKNMGSYLRRFESEADMTWDPLTGAGWGGARAVSGGSQEFLLCFIYLALHSLVSTAEMPKALPIDIAFDSVEAGIKQIKDHANEIFGVGVHQVITNTERLMGWLQSCRQEREKAKDKEIAKAKLKPSVIHQFESGFWDGYAKAASFLSYCLKNGHVTVKRDTAAKSRLVFPKRIFLDQGMSEIKRLSTDAGRHFGFRLDQELLRLIATDKPNTQGLTAEKNTKKDDSPRQVQGDKIREIVKKAANWLNNSDCDDSGIIVFHSSECPDKFLWDDNNFVPSWREANESSGFEGSYLGYPLIWLRGKRQEAQCIALNLKTWQGIHARSELVKDKKFGEVNVREWTTDEIEKAIREGNIKDTDRCKAQGSCPVEITRFWELATDEMPNREVFAL